MDICQLRSFLRSERTIGNHAKTLDVGFRNLNRTVGIHSFDNRDMPVIAVRTLLAWSEYHNIANVTCRIVNPIAESASGITPTPRITKMASGRQAKLCTTGLRPPCALTVWIVIAGITGAVVRIEARRKKTGVLIHENGDIGIVGNGL